MFLESPQWTEFDQKGFESEWLSFVTAEEFYFPWRYVTESPLLVENYKIIQTNDLLRVCGIFFLFYTTDNEGTKYTTMWIKVCADLFPRLNLIIQWS